MDKCACCGRPGYALCRFDGGGRIHSDCWDEHHSDPTTEWPPGHTCAGEVSTVGKRIAIRSRKRGPAHALPARSDGRGPWDATLCGRTLSSLERIPWDNTAPEDRCRTCARRVAEGGAS